MPMWPVADTPVLERVLIAHREATGSEATQSADAPATWLLLGEHVDYAGGIVAISQASPRVAVAFSPRPDDVISVTRHALTPKGVTTEVDQLSTGVIAELAAEQQIGVDDRGRPVTPPAPTGGIAAILGGIVWTMINRQLLPRDTTGMDITVVDDIPAQAGLGAAAATEAAFALALQADAGDLDDAPMRTRLAEVCSQSAEMFSAVPPLRARHTAALRGTDESMSIIDYADESLTTAPHPQTAGISWFMVLPPGEATDQSALIRDRHRFLDAACHAFGAESLRMLPDAPQRVIDWLKAVHKVHGPENQPSIQDASAWLAFHEQETHRVNSLSRALRSRRTEDIWQLQAESQAALASSYGLSNAADIVELCLIRGAEGARAASAGTSAAVIAGVDKQRAKNFATDLAANGFIVVELQAGAVAELNREN